MTEADKQCEYIYSDDFDVDEDVLSDWQKYGYIIVRKLFGRDEMKLILEALESDDGIKEYTYDLPDVDDNRARMCLWKVPGNDMTGLIARVHKMASTMEKILGDEVYHYHTKLMKKETGTGGFHWHQDYGYWYYGGTLLPDDMATAFIAVDDNTRENGCLQIIEGSHKAGRIEHRTAGNQMCADMERVKQLQEMFNTRYVELNAGDVLFFRSTILHTSSVNESKKRRWALLVAYNTKRNDPLPFYNADIPFYNKYVKMEKVDNDAITNCKSGTATSMEGKDYLIRTLGEQIWAKFGH